MSAHPPSAPFRLPRTAKGERPQFSAAPEVDRVMAIAMAIASEVAVLRERLDTFETLSASRGLVSAADIESFVPTAEHEKRREQWRHDFLDRVLYILRAEADTAPDRVARRSSDA
jgi:hypothetical protein